MPVAWLAVRRDDRKVAVHAGRRQNFRSERGRRRHFRECRLKFRQPLGYFLFNASTRAFVMTDMSIFVSSSMENQPIFSLLCGSFIFGTPFFILQTNPIVTQCCFSY